MQVSTFFSISRRSVVVHQTELTIEWLSETEKSLMALQTSQEQEEVHCVVCGKIDSSLINCSFAKKIHVVLAYKS